MLPVARLFHLFYARLNEIWKQWSSCMLNFWIVNNKCFQEQCQLYFCELENLENLPQKNITIHVTNSHFCCFFFCYYCLAWHYTASYLVVISFSALSVWCIVFDRSVLWGIMTVLKVIRQIFNTVICYDNLFWLTRSSTYTASHIQKYENNLPNGETKIKWEREGERGEKERKRRTHEIRTNIHLYRQANQLCYAYKWHWIFFITSAEYSTA